MQSPQTYALPPDLQQAMHLAFEYRNGGRLNEAESIYQSCLTRYPQHPLLLGQLGEIHLQRGNAQIALPLLEQARLGAPGSAQHWLMHAQCLLALDRGKEAKKILTEAMSKGLRHPLADDLLKQVRTGKKKTGKPIPLNEALKQLDALFLAGEYAEVEMLGRDMQQRYPKSPQIRYLVGMAGMYLGHRPEALAAFERAVALDPARVNVYLNLAQVLHLLERDEEAVAVLKRAVKLKPDFLEAYQDLAHSLQQLGRSEEAMEAYRIATNLQPDDPVAYRGLGHTLQLLGRAEDAVDAYRMAATISPDDPAVHEELAKAQRSVLRYEEAIASFRRFLELRPESGGALNLLAGSLLDMGRFSEAQEVYRRALALEPAGAFAIHSNMLLGLNYQPDTTAEVMLGEARAFGKKAEQGAKPDLAYPNPPDPERRLRIGLVSGDLGQHPVGFFLLNVVASIDPNLFELFAYQTVLQMGPVNERLRKHIPHWREIADPAVTHEATANTIRADAIDILIDLNGHTGDNRLPLFAWKPAPVQMTWLGYLGTTGLEAMDYILADQWALPAGEENHFTETPWRMPESYICFSPPEVDVGVGALPAIGNGYITFGSFNNLNKITDQVVACWARVLLSVPGSKLYLKTKNLGGKEMRTALVARFVRHGITEDRLLLEGALDSHEAHFRAYQKVDIALDPYPYPGITTSVEALWMGVPIVTLAGDRFITHQGETIMHNLGLPDWIAADEDAYVAKAAAFAGDIQALAAVRAGLREQLLASPLCDAPRFARNFEHALRGMWRVWCEQKKPVSITA